MNGSNILSPLVFNSEVNAMLAFFFLVTYYFCVVPVLYRHLKLPKSIW